MKKLISGILVLTLVVSLVAVGCGGESTDGDKPYEYKEEDTKIIELSGQTKLILRNTNGGIHIEGSDATDRIHVAIAKTVRSYSLEDAQEHMGDIEASDYKTAEEVHIEVEHPMTSVRNYQADFAITLPIHFDFEITVGNGSIELDNVESTETKAGVGNGYIGADMTLADSCAVDFEVGNGNVHADMTLMDSCSMEFRVGNGNIEIKIPENTSTQVKASVGNGEITYAGLSFENIEVSLTELEGSLGDGNSNIILAVGNGDIQLRGKPGAAAQE
ncbi:DUF4097 family beta strand repeat-containing protein [Chloroflexota bacterium]